MKAEYLNIFELRGRVSSFKKFTNKEMSKK